MADKQPKAQELRALPEADLRAQLVKLRQELWGHRVKVKAGALPQTHLLPMVRRQIARLETVLRQRQGANPRSPLSRLVG
jgi:large subunit ribosomal protein L29